MKERTVILVSLNFPPSQIASVHRARQLARHLPSNGWRPVIVSVDERYHKEPIDADLGRLVSRSVEVHRVRAVPLSLTSPLGLADLSLRSWFSVRRKVLELIASEDVRAIFITGWPFYQMLSAGRFDAMGVPVVLDFQDPWVSAWGETQPWWSKAGLSHALAKLLEPRALRGASFVTSVSDVQNREMAARYPWLDNTRMAAIPIGGEPEDFDALRASPPAHPIVRLDPSYIHLSYVGTFLPRSGPMVRAIMRAVAELRRSSPDLAIRLRLNFVGTSNQPDGHGAYRVKPIAEEEGVADLVSEFPPRVPYLQALNLLANSQGLLLIGSDEPHYTASKIYPALMSGRPYLSLFHSASSAHAILSLAGGGRAFAFSRSEELNTLQPAMTAALRELATTPERLGLADPAAFAEFTGNAVARSFARVFDRVAASSRK